MIENFDGVIFDIDGVLEFQGKVYPGAIQLINSLRQKGIVLRILTNSTLKSKKSAAEKLNTLGFTVNEKEVITASSATAKYLESLNPRSVWVMLKREGLREFDAFVHDTENPEYIVIGDYREDFNFTNMNKALRLLLNGAKLIVMQSELIDFSLGNAELNIGSWAAMLENAAEIKGVHIGKPNRYVFDIILETMPVERNNVLMVGDKISSDILGAKHAGIKSALIKTGEFRETDLDGDIQPDYIFENVRDVGRLFDLTI
jgi:inorganic pyrophosphatase